MRVLFTSEPGMGHLTGLISLARELFAQGHEPWVAGPPSIVTAFRAAGIPGLQVIDEPSTTDSPETFSRHPALRQLPREQWGVYMRSEVSVRERAVGLAPEVVKAGERLHPDVIVRDATELAGWAAAERLGIPDVSFEVSAHWPVKMWNENCGDAIIQLRDTLKLSSRVDFPAAGMYQYLHLNNAPGLLLDDRSLLPQSSMDISPSFFEGVTEAAVPDVRFTSPHVYMAFGSIYRVPQSIYEDLVTDVAQYVPLVAVGSEFVNETSLYRDTFIPQTRFMDNCAAVVCHGGRNTVLTALRAGIPVISAPLGSDHFLVAASVERAGAGRTVAWDAAQMSSMLREVLANADYAVAAARVAMEIAAMPSAAEVVSVMASRFT